MVAAVAKELKATSRGIPLHRAILADWKAWVKGPHEYMYNGIPWQFQSFLASWVLAHSGPPLFVGWSYIPRHKTWYCKRTIQNAPDCESRINYLLIFDKRSLMRRVRLSRFFICCDCNRLRVRAITGGDYDINSLCFNKIKKRTCVEWNGKDHDCYPNKCCPSKKIIQRDEGQGNLGRSGTRNTNLYIDKFYLNWPRNRHESIRTELL